MRPSRANLLAGPRSFTLTSTDFPFSRFVTFREALKGMPQIAQVREVSLKISMLAVVSRIPGSSSEYQEDIPLYIREAESTLVVPECSTKNIIMIRKIGLYLTMTDFFIGALPL